MLRDGAQHGPYTTGQLASYIADRRILPQDSVWYQGAAVRLEVSQLPPFGAAAPAATPDPAPAAAQAVAQPQAPLDMSLQPGETKLGSWNVNHMKADEAATSGTLTITGTLTVTNRRILFDVMLEAYVAVEVADQNTIDGMKRVFSFIIDKDQLADVRMEDALAEKQVRVWLTSGETCSLSRGMMMSMGPIAAAIRQR